jgi:MFS family permease
MSVGVWQVALPDLVRALSLSPGTLGAALTVTFWAGFPMLVLGGRMAERWGARVPMALTALLIVIAFSGFTLVNEYWVLVTLLFSFYAGVGGLDVSMNAAAIAYEQITGRRMMAYFHAAFSGLAAVGALLSGLLIYVGVPCRLLYLGIAVLMVIYALVVWRSAALPGPSAQAKSAEASQGQVPFYRMPAIVLLAVIAGLCFLSEGTLENWSAIYLRSTLGLPAVVGAAGPAVFHTAMVTGRVTSARIVALIGRRRLLTTAGLVAASGVVLALATTYPPLILAGLLIAGLALAGVVPADFSLAGDLAPGRAGTVSSFVTTTGYVGASIGPALIGGLAELVGLRIALGAIILTGLLIFTLSLQVREAAPSRRDSR